MRKWIVGIISLLVVVSVQAELKLPAVFSDGMVLQRDQKVAVWGWADPGAKVTVAFAGQKQTAKADLDGKFMVRLKKMKASAEPRSLKVVSGTDSAEVKNVLVGEVWLCSGQSNMQMAVQASNNFEKEKSAANYPGIRMFLTDLKASKELQQDCTGSWRMCTPENIGPFSATAYFFGRKLHKELDVPIGLVRSCWGGTRIESWSPMASLEKFPSVMAYKAEQDRLAEIYDPIEAEKEHTKKVLAWEKKDPAKRPQWKPQKRVHPHAWQNYPANLYNAMINPLVPYSMRGAIWYQGEANAHIEQAMLYRELLENMVVQWRRDWNDEFPFYAVQLVNFKQPAKTPVQDSGWAFIRESFLKFHKEVPNVGIAVGIDVGEANDIHPKNKQAIGLRLAHQALAKTYGKKIVPGGPIYKSMKKDGNKIILKFDDIGSGLMEQGGEPLKWLAIAGADKQFVSAQAAIVDDTLIVSSEVVPDPVAVRYAWANNPVGCNLFNKEGFPASPFRTDDWAPSGE